jgi:hypothetical protein
MNTLSTDSEEETTKDLISLAKASKISGFSPAHLRLLVKQGKLWGIKIGRDWVTTTSALQKYLDSDRRPGPKPKD